ncbi:MAG: efflux RND transporter periplasmic adaptor subunit, partial [Tepidisphaeraceae bacterium]
MSSVLLSICVSSANAATDEGHGTESGHADEVTLQAEAVRQNNITIAPVELRTLVGSFVAPARVEFNREAMAQVGALVSGRVVELKARVGESVKKEDVLLVVESTELGKAQSEFLQRRTEADVAAAAVSPAKEAFDRAKKLYDDSRGIALAEVQKREVDYRSSVGAASTSKAAYQAAENGLRLLGFNDERLRQLTESGEVDPHYAIRSPIAGTVMEREVTLGELVSPDKDLLLVVANLDTLWVLADVPEARLGSLGVGSRAEVRLAALPGEALVGEVSLVSGEVDALTRTARLRIVVPNTERRLRPGMFARALLQARRDEKAMLAVPEAAVQTVEGKTCVFVPIDGEPNTFAPKAVVVGRTVNGYVPIVSGVREGERVVVSGSFILKA